jgi:hypothetical protein
VKVARDDTRLPLERFDQEMNKEFDLKHLNEKAQKVYQSIVDDKMHIGNPI